MFEGLVRQLLLGYLGRYVKDIQKEQLKITLWNEEVLLENVDLILEAFDYLQLPFALKQGRVGRLSIKIPWKKLGWDPIIIILEDVFISASQRDDQEWSLDAVERREFAGKKAKLAAAELAKLSRRVCDNQAGQSFISYITAKVLDSIQVSVRNFHVLYSDLQLGSAQLMFGLKFSSLTIMKQNLVGSIIGRVRAGQVNKVVEIKGLEIYSSTFHLYGDSMFSSNARASGNKFDNILKPFDVSVSLMVNRSGNLENDLPQYSVSAELASLVLSLDDVQLQQILILLDYLCTSRLREQYGRYRPRCSLSRKPDGWPKLWWQYAQQSILSVVRKKLKRTSWRYLGHRLSCRRKYVNLYKTKLGCLQQEQSIDESVIRELEQMEKELDLDDILSYRSAAECELQEVLLSPSDPNTGANGGTFSVEKSQNDERSSGSSRGWLNWLSRGMLGAGGTEDSSQFSGVVSDEVVKDIYEATEFHPMVLSGVEADVNDEFHTCAIKFTIGRISATLRNRNSGQKIAKLIFERAIIDCNLWGELANFVVFIKSAKMVYPCNKKVILLMGGSCAEENIIQNEQSSLRIQVDVSPKQDFELSMKLTLQPLEATWDTEFFVNIMEFSTILKSFEFHHNRVMSSLNAFKDVNARLVSKAAYILSNHKKVIWDVSIANVTINVPWRNVIAEQCYLVLELGSLLLKSKSDMDSLVSNVEEQSFIRKHPLSSSCTWDSIMGFQLKDLRNHFEVKLNDCAVKLLMPHYPHTVYVLEEFCASLTLASSVIPDESILNQLEICVAVSQLLAHLSPSICESMVALIALVDALQTRTRPVTPKHTSSFNTESDRFETPVFGFSISANLDSASLHVDLANDGENSSVIMFDLHELDICYSLKELQECWICMETLKIITYLLRDKKESHILASCGDAFASNSENQQDMGVGLSNQSDNCTDSSSSTEACFFLHYEAHRSLGYVCNKCTVSLKDADLHCYPYIFGLLIGFFDRISSYGTSGAENNSISPSVDDKSPKTIPGFGFQRFGFSNFFLTGSSDCASISLDHYPFITICNFGSLGSLESSLLYSIPDWRKVFSLRDRKIRFPNCSIKKGSKNLHDSSLISTSGMAAFLVSGSSSDTNQSFIDISLSGIRVHFHDSSCIVGTVTLPSSKSSLLIYEDGMDLLFSVEGLVLTSSWWTKTSHKFLWGPALPYLSPILNLRVKKGNVGSSSSQLEVSIGIQHVCCVLPTEYLAILIGYFSLPDWSSNSGEQIVTEHNEEIYKENGSPIVYKFEILDSTLIVPAENDSLKFLKVDIQQLYCSFIHNSSFNNVLKDIPPECIVSAHKVAKHNHCLNIFGRDLILSFLLFNDDGHGFLISDQDAGYENVILIAPLSADVWVTMPRENKSTCGSSSPSTCIMSRIHNCQLIAGDYFVYDGFEALLDVIDQFSSVGDQSKLFASDVLQFLHIKRCLKENGPVSPAAPGFNFTEVKCCADSFSIKLHQCRKDSVLLKEVAKVDMQFICCVSLMNETAISLDFNFSTLAFYSLLSSVMLARCTINCSTSSVLGICLSKSDHGDNELRISLPSLDIWLHMSDWSEVIDLYYSYSQKTKKTSHMDVSSKCSARGRADLVENLAVTISESAVPNSNMSTYHVSENMKQDTAVLIVRSENIGITFHIPIRVSEEALEEYGVAEILEEGPQNVASNLVLGKHCKFITITTHGKSCELLIAGRDVKLKANLEKTSGMVGTLQEKSVNSWPFFQIFQVNLETEVCRDQMELVRVSVHVQCDGLDVWLSHQVLYFWHGVVYDIPEAEPSQITFPSMEFKIQLRKISLLISDGRWSCSGHLLEILVRNFLLCASLTQSCMDGSITSELHVKYNNIRKVSWEPFIEPWKFQINMIRKHEMSVLLNSSFITDIDLTATTELNLNFTESLVECLFRTIEMIRDAWGLMGPDDHPDTQIFLKPQFAENVSGGRFAPYILQNLTSLPLTYHVYQGILNSDEFNVLDMEGESVQPATSVPIYLNETPDEQLFRYRRAYSSDRLTEKQSNAVAHHFMTIQLDGTSVPSAPISMDLVGITYFEVDFSKASKQIEFDWAGDASKYNINSEVNVSADASSGFVVPVVFDVSVQHYSKLIRLYSTVILSNATSIPMELRFDIPFGLSPKILDPIYPGQEFPLPLHLAEAGRMRWRPLGESYLWSEAHNVSNILLQESKIGYLRSFVCYPSHPSSDPFRCCISVQNILLPASGNSKKGSSLHVNNTLKQPVESCGQVLHEFNHSKNRFVHLVTLSTPFVVNNYLPESISLTIETSGITRTSLLSEVQTSFHDIDPSHDLGLEFNTHGFRPSGLKFPRAETFSTMSKFSGTKFSLSETVTFHPESSSDPIYVTMERTMDAFSGARELFISVPYLLYNCTGFPLTVSHSSGEKKGSGCTISCCYDFVEHELVQGKKDGLSLLSLDQDTCARATQIDGQGSSLIKNHIVSARKNVNPHLGKFLSKPGSYELFHEQSDRHDLGGQKHSLYSVKKHLCSSSQLTLRETDFFDNGREKVQACMYSPLPISAASEIMVRVSRCLTGCVTQNMPDYSWSGPFLLVPPSGSTSVVIPQSSSNAALSNAAFIISVTASGLAGPFAGRTRAITFQPRYVISNSCSKDLCYKQKGTDFVFHLGVGQHSHLHWTDTTRELLVSVRFNEPGCQWSGSFLPDHLGDTQLKMRNYVSGELNMIRVEVQNADVSISDEKIVGSLHGNSGTSLILLSDDDTGYMPYRIDNFSKERLRVYQQKCETFDTIIHPYTSCPYAWDEPCYPHRLTVEVPGERVVGSYALDDLKEYLPVHLQSTAEKPERILLLSNHAEGATKVLSIIDSSYHILKDLKNATDPWFQEKRKQDQTQEKFVNYRERFSFNIPYIGVSLINSSYSQELLFACAKNITIDLLQSLDQQKLSFQISSLQIDNQLLTTPYPVILSFNHEYRSNPTGHRTKEDGAKSKSERVLQITSDSSCEPVFYLSIAKWRKKDISLVSFQHIILRVAEFRLELEQEVILSMLDFFKTVSPSFQSTVLPFSDSTLLPVMYDLGFEKGSSVPGQSFEYVKERHDQLHGINNPASNRSHRSGAFLPSIVPIGAPWQQIYLLARRQKKIYVELFDLSPVKFTLSFSSAPWMLRNGVLTSGESLIHRGLMALADVEGARIHLKQLTIAHHMASWESIQEILMRHYTRQLLHEMYKVFGSAGVIGNPLGFARSLGLGIRDFLSVPARSILQSPTGLISGMAQGTTSLVSNTVYALSDAATQFSKAAHKGIVAFTFDDQAVARMEKQQKGVASHSKGVINEVLEGLTGLLQSPIKEAEKHGLPGLLSGIALGVTGLVARPAASILEVTGKTAQSIRNRSRLYHMRSQRYRVRLPRPVSREVPLKPYSWEEAIGTSVLMEGDDGLKFKDEVLVMCKALKEGGKFVIITERLILIVSCSSLVELGKPEFRGVAIDPGWVIESEICLDSVIHCDSDEEVVNIVGSSSDGRLSRQNQHHPTTKRGSGSGGGARTKWWNNHPSTPLPLFQTSLELASKEDAVELLHMLLSTIEQGKGQGWGRGYILHQSNVK